MSLLSGLTTDSDIKEEKDTLGSSFGPVESDAYKFKISMAYLDKSKGGALGLHLHLETADKQNVRQTLWITSGDAKGNKTYYVNQKGEKNPLPGFTHADALCLLTVGKSIAEMEPEDKVVSIYNFDAGKEIPTTVPVVVELLDEEVLIGMQKQIVDKNALNQSTNRYEPTGETREVNEIDKVFRAKDGMTTAEIRAQAEEANFINSWREKWQGKTRDRSTKGAGTGAQAGAPKAGAPAGGRKSLFN